MDEHLWRLAEEMRKPSLSLERAEQFEEYASYLSALEDEDDEEVRSLSDIVTSTL